MHTHFKPARESSNNSTGQYRYQYRLTIVNTIFHNHITVSNNCSNAEAQGVLYFGTGNSNNCQRQWYFYTMLFSNEWSIIVVEQQYYVKSYGKAYSMETCISSNTAQMNCIYCLTSLKSQLGTFHLVQVTIVHISGTSDFPRTFPDNTGLVAVVENPDLYLNLQQHSV